MPYFGSNNSDRMAPKTKIFVGKLPSTARQHSLKKLFERYGEVTECSILGHYGFVHMKTEEEALEAIDKLNNYEIDGYKISVEQSTGERRGPGGGGGRGRGRGGRGGGDHYGRGGGGDHYGRGGRMLGRPGPYDRRPPPMVDRYGPQGPPPPPMRSSFFDSYDRRDRHPADRQPLPLPRDPYPDPYDRYDPYDRMAPPPISRRSPPPVDRLDRMERRAPPLGYGRRDDLYDAYSRDRDLYAAHDMYASRRSPPRGMSPPRRYPGPRHF